jgi:hypothetical protein
MKHLIESKIDGKVQIQKLKMNSYKQKQPSQLNTHSADAANGLIQ